MAAHDNLGVLSHGEDQCLPSSNTSQVPAASLVSQRSPGQTDFWFNLTQQWFFDYSGCEDLSVLTAVCADFACVLAMQAAIENQFV